MKVFIFFLYCLSGTMVFLSSIYLYSKIVGQKPEIDKKYLYAALICIGIQNYFQLKNYAVLGPIITIVWLVIFGRKFFKTSWKETILCLVMIWVILLLIDILTMFHMNRIELYNFDPMVTQIFKGLSSITMSILVVLVAKLSIIVQGLTKIFKELSRLTVRKVVIIFTLVLYFILGLLCYKHMNNQQDIIYLSIIILISLITLIVLVYVIYLNYEIVTLKATNEITENNNEVLLKTLNEYRIMKHNLNNKMLGIKSIGNKETKIMIDDIQKEYAMNKYLKNEIPSMPSGTNGFILEKLYNYADKDLKVQVDNTIKEKVIDLLGPRNYNLFCEALGVTLDNALEAASESKDKIVFLEFREEKECVYVKVMNSFKGQIDTDALGTIEYTSKSNGHGLGLYSLFNKKSLYITTSIKNNYFRSEIKVNKKPSA